MTASARTIYIVNEIFYSLQGEGHWTGRPAIFVRFAHCNLSCPFCDTDFKTGTHYSEGELIAEVSKFAPCQFIVFTGGEPTLQLTESLINKLHKGGFYLAMETNGTRPYPKGLDWVTVSPKNDFLEGVKLFEGNYMASEVKVVFTGLNSPEKYGSLGQEKFIQPCDTGNPMKNEEIIAKSIEWLKEHPDWRLSLQTHKIVGVR